MGVRREVQLLAAGALLALGASAPAASPYDIGTPTLRELHVSPTGDDSRDGLTPATALRTMTAAWTQIPSDATLATTGYRINLAAGTYACEPSEPDNCQNFVANRHGTGQFPVILAGPATGTATVRGGLDFGRMSYLYLIDLTLVGGGELPLNNSGNNLLHLAEVDHVLLRRVKLLGPDCANDTCTNLQEVLKVNQADHLYIENSELRGAWHTGIDYFAVQYSHVIGCRIHTVGQWCMYAKGGSAYLWVEGNEFDHAQLGFGAGQSANLAVMRPPWLHYDVYDVKFVNNVLHDLRGVGLSARGAYDTLFAYNTFVDVATDTDGGYPLMEAVPAERGCNPTDEVQEPVPECLALIAQGAWGPNFLTDNTESIPNRNVGVYNNIFYNRGSARTLYNHFGIRGPQPRPDGFVNLPDTITTDDGLVLAGNVIWNGPTDHPLGFDESTGCLESHPTCSEIAVRAANAVNTMEPQLVDPAGGDYHPAPGGNLSTFAAAAIPDFTWTSFSPAVPTGTLSNYIATDRNGSPRPNPGPPGAYVVPAPATANGFVVR